MPHQLLQILAATMITAGLLILAIAQLPVISQATGMRGGDQLLISRPGAGDKTSTCEVMMPPGTSGCY